MKVLFLTNNAVSAPLIRWLDGRAEVVTLGEKLGTAEMQACRPDLVVSYSYRHIIKPEVLALLPGRFVNLHIALLPHNRGADPNAWSVLDNTPKGVTIHVIDEGLDTGPILFQRRAHFDEAVDTLGGSYAALQAMIQDLFIENWEAIRDGAAAPIARVGAGSYHHSREFAALKERLMGADGWNVTLRALRERYELLRATA